MRLFVYYVFFQALVGCASTSSYVPETQPLDRSALPTPDMSFTIPNLGSCTDSDDNTVEIDSTSPITVLVHGCNGSAGRFRSLAQLYAFHGQQAICYSYDDREKLVLSAEKLATAIESLADKTNNQDITIIGHSLGGLISRKAVEVGNNYSSSLSDKNLNLITISAPLSGIDAASYCGIKPLHWLTIGAVPGICWLITGDNWTEITAHSPFIKNPKSLISSVDEYLKIVTNETDTCRRKTADGRCIESDDVFDVSEQYHPFVDSYPNVTGVEVDAGHVEIVGDKAIIPRKLLSILQKYDMLSHTPSERQKAFEMLLADLY